MLKRFWFWAVAAGLGMGSLFVFNSCKGDGLGLGADGNPPTSYYNAYVQPIFTEKCVSCHKPGGAGYNPTGGDANNGLDLSPGVSFSKLVGQATFEEPTMMPGWRVLAGEPDSSYLIQKISSDNPKFGSRMPIGGSLSSGEINLLKDWVLCGAPGPDGGPLCAPTVPPGFFRDFVQPVFDNNCTGCHIDGGLGWGATGGWDVPPSPTALSLADSVSYSLLVGVSSYGDNGGSVRVKPGFPEESFLYNKISADTGQFGGTQQMPPGYALINSDPAGVEFIRRWIAAGAPEN